MLDEALGISTYRLGSPQLSSRSRGPRRSMDQATRRTLYDRQEGRCVYCRRYFPVDIMHVDHKRPFSKGGSDEMDNLQVLCPTCNSSKGSYTDEEYRRRAGLAQPATAAIASSVVTFGRPSRRKFRGDIESMLWIPVRLNGVSVGYIKQTTVGADWKTGREGSWVIDPNVLGTVGIERYDPFDFYFRTREKAESAIKAIAERANRGCSVIDRDFLVRIVGQDAANKIVDQNKVAVRGIEGKVSGFWRETAWGTAWVSCGGFVVIGAFIAVVFYDYIAVRLLGIGVCTVGMLLVIRTFFVDDLSPDGDVSPTQYWLLGFGIANLAILVMLLIIHVQYMT